MNSLSMVRPLATPVPSPGHHTHAQNKSKHIFNCFIIVFLQTPQVITPVAIMTSDAKGNHQRMVQLMESLNWFGRGREAFRLFRCVWSSLEAICSRETY